MKALSLTQPWASLVAIGAKTYETRSWSTSYRGQLAIAAAKGFPRDCQELVVLSEPFKSVLAAAGLDLGKLHEVRGHIVAVVELVDIVRVDGSVPRSMPAPMKHEMPFGDYSPGRFAWIMSNLRRLERPVPAKGALGIWQTPADVELAVVEQLKEVA